MPCSRLCLCCLRTWSLLICNQRSADELCLRIGTVQLTSIQQCKVQTCTHTHTHACTPARQLVQSVSSRQIVPEDRGQILEGKLVLHPPPPTPQTHTCRHMHTHTRSTLSPATITIEFPASAHHLTQSPAHPAAPRQLGPTDYQRCVSGPNFNLLHLQLLWRPPALFVFSSLTEKPAF